MSKLVACLAVLGMFQFGCDRDNLTDGDPFVPDIADGDAVEVESGQPPALPVPPNDPSLLFLVATHQADSRDLIAHAGALYWIDDSIEGSQLRAVAIGDSGSWGNLAKLNESPFSIAARDDFIYVSSPFGQNIDRVELASGAVTTFASFTAAPLGLATDRDAVYATMSDGRVVRITNDGATTDVLATVSDTPVTVAVAGEELYFGTASGAIHHSSTLPGIGSEKISSGHSFAGGIAIDDTHVYWASDVERKLMRVDRATRSDIQSVFDEVFGLSGVAADGAFVYATSQGDDTLRRFEPQSADDTLEIVGDTFRAPAGPVLVDGQLYFVSESAAAIALLVE